MTYKLHEKLKEIPIENKYVSTPRGVNPARLSDEDIKQIEQAFKDEGYVKVEKRRYRDKHREEYFAYTIQHPDGSGESVKVPQFNYMSESQWQKKAIEEGWVNAPEVTQTLVDMMTQTKHELNRLTMTSTPTYRIADKKDSSGGYPMTELMTGKEWFDRFENELPPTIKLHEVARKYNFGRLRDEVIVAAKRASGLEDKE